MVFFANYFFSLVAFLETVLLVLAYFCRSFLRRKKRQTLNPLTTERYVNLFLTNKTFLLLALLIKKKT